MRPSNFSERIAYTLEVGKTALKSKVTSQLVPDFIPSEMFGKFRSASLSLLAAIYGKQHSYFSEFERNVVRSLVSDVKRGIGILAAVSDEEKAGYLYSLRGLVTAEVFTDFLEMAEHLLEEGYKDAAAVIAGSSLEQHLRRLADKHEIPTTRLAPDGNMVPKKADVINSDLKTADVYQTLDHKNVTAWLDLRNKAAHGEYSKYVAQQVDNMIQGTREFIGRVRA